MPGYAIQDGKIVKILRIHKRPRKATRNCVSKRIVIKALDH